MADIDVERKGTSPLPWILGLILLALLAWALWSMLDDDDDGEVAVVPADTVADTTPIPPVAGGPAAGGDVVQRFQQSCTQARQEMGAEHQFVADCLRQLADAADTVLSLPHAQGVNARGELEELRRRAQALEQSPPDATDHAALAAGGFTSAAALLDRMQREGFPDLSGEATRIREAATALNAEGMLLEQRAEVQRFFDAAATALQRMMMAPAAT